MTSAGILYPSVASHCHASKNVETSIHGWALRIVHGEVDQTAFKISKTRSGILTDY
jgi:hypothetical protein